MDEPLLDFNQELISLQQDYDLYCIYINKLNNDINDLNEKSPSKKSNWIREFLPKVEKLGNFLSTLNCKIKAIESNDSNKSIKYRQKSMKTTQEIKSKASNLYQNFNDKFINVLKPEPNSNKKQHAKSINETHPSEINLGSQQVKTQIVKTNSDKALLTNNNFKRDLNNMRNEDLDLILKISNQTMQISKEMKNSAYRAESSINTIEANIVSVNDNLKNANNETTKLQDNSSGSISKYIWILIITFIITIIICILVYKLLFS